jgi:uncharacterized protein (TIGR02145 family)
MNKYCIAGILPIITMGLIFIFTNSCEKFKEDEPITDIDGNIYQTVKIYKQIWMAENLRTTKYNNGTTVPLVSDSTEWFNLESPGYCWYNNDEASYRKIYGALYNFYTVNTAKICPTGWHVPTERELRNLILKLDHNLESVNSYGIESEIAGGKLKETGSAHWSNGNIGATNETGFTALPGGERCLYPFTGGEIGWITSPSEYRKRSNGFYDLGYMATFWSSTYEVTYPDEEGRGGGTGGMRRTFYSDNTWSVRDYLYQKTGCSIRCLKD